MSDRYSFRFTQEEIEEMRFVLEANAFSRPPRVEMEGMAWTFNKAREEKGMNACVRVDSVHRWFKKNRHTHFKESNTIMQMDQNINENVGVGQMLALPPPVSDVEQALVRLQKYRKVQPGAICHDPRKSNLLSVGEAKEILVGLKETRVADFKSCERHFELAIQTLMEKGSLLEREKAELLEMLDKLRKISTENEDIRKELLGHEAFVEELHECEENTYRLVQKAKELEEKYDSFTQKVSDCTQEIVKLEAALKKAKAEEEVIECNKEDIARELGRLAESLQSANVHHQILKQEEDASTERMIKLSQCLQKNAEEWVRLTSSMKFTFIL